MNRRDFIVRMLGTAAALAVLPKIEALVESAPIELQESIGEAATMDAVVAEGWRLFKIAMADCGFSIADGDVVKPTKHQRICLGSLVRDVGTITDQFSVAVYGYELTNERHIAPAMASLAERCAYSGVDKFTVLPMPFADVERAYSGGLRFVRVYDIQTDDFICRFDVIGARTDAGKAKSAAFKRTSEKARQRRLAAAIRERLKHPTRVLPLPA